ncbi:hypothetical protein DPMN_045467 [Dreissena polymorpha]|uniref:Uncharacterized protein n=1 Tax=Dreissena polymorpha TaxID=45954 RepID=A0A9D4D620_DREPO|nr:hypothetical protein DPMN_045467 [Dreissena polymorpha]
MRDAIDGRYYIDTYQQVYRIFNQRLTENSMERANYRIKVRIGQTFYKETFITVSIDDVVTIQVLESMNDNLQDPTWQWLFMSTSGEVTTVSHCAHKMQTQSRKKLDLIDFLYLECFINVYRGYFVKPSKVSMKISV